MGRQLESAEVSSRSEGVLPSRKRGSEERGALEDPRLERTDGSEMCISVMTVILKSLGVAPASDKMAGGAAVDLGFERGLVVDPVTG